MYPYLRRVMGAGCAALIVIVGAVVVLGVVLFLLPEGVYMGTMTQNDDGQWVGPTAQVYAERFASFGHALFLLAACFVLGIASQRRKVDNDALFWTRVIALLAAVFVVAACVGADLNFGFAGVGTMLDSLWDSAKGAGLALILGGFVWWCGWEMSRNA